MKKKNKGLQNTIILIVILLALSGAVWYLLSTQDSALNKQLVAQISSDKVQSIEISRTDTAGNPQHYTVQREGPNTWKLIQPVQDAANTTLVTNMAKVFEKLEAQNTIHDAKSLADYGLDKPVVTAKIGYDKTKSLTLLIGQETPFSGTFYAKFAGKPDIMVVSTTVKSDLNTDLNTIREKKVLDIDIKDVQRIEFKNRNTPDYQLVKTNDSWALELPFQEKMVQAKVNQVVSSLNALIADDFGENDKTKEYGLDNPELWLELTLNNGSKVIVKANKFQDIYYLTVNTRQGVFKLSSSQTLEWQFDPEDQLDKRLVVYAQNEVQSVKYQRQGYPDQEFAGNNLGKIWTPISLLNATGFYYSTSKSQPVAANSAKTWQPLYKYTFQRNSPLVLAVYAAPGNKYLVTSNERQYIYEINKSDIDSLNQKLMDALKPDQK